MHFRFTSQLRFIFIALIVIVTCLTFSLVGQTALASSSSPASPGVTNPPYNPQIGQAIVTQEEQIALGENPWPNGCVANSNGLHCVPYSWGAGHGAQPGPSKGTCSGYTGHKPCIASQTFGLDCSGFTRWVYALVYSKDVLGSGSTGSQKTMSNVQKVPKGDQEPGDLVFFPGHVGIYTGKSNSKDTMIDAPHTYDKPHSRFNPSSQWVQAYVRIDMVSSASVSGYYRFALPIPQLASSYSGTGHNITYNINANFALTSVTEDQQGNISGNALWTPPLYGSGPFTGKVNADDSLTFTTPTTDIGVSITYTGTVHGQSLSGSYTTNDGQTGTWQVSATS